MWRSLSLSAMTVMLVACAGRMDGPQYFAGIQILETGKTAQNEVSLAEDLKIDLCFKTSEKKEPICYRGITNQATLRIPAKDGRLALSSITLLGEKPYGDKNYYYEWQPKHLAWLELNQPADRVFVGKIFAVFGPRKDEAYPELGIAVLCSNEIAKAIEAKELSPVLSQCLKIGSVNMGNPGADGGMTTLSMPPKIMYRPFGRDPDVPYGELSSDIKQYHD
jgi:hypothetical protein